MFIRPICYCQLVVTSSALTDWTQIFVAHCHKIFLLENISENEERSL